MCFHSPVSILSVGYARLPHPENESTNDLTELTIINNARCYDILAHKWNLSVCVSVAVQQTHPEDDRRGSAIIKTAVAVYSPECFRSALRPSSFLYLVLHGVLVQHVQFSAQFVHLVADVIHLGTEALVAGQIGVKLLLVLPALLVWSYLWVQPGVGYINVRLQLLLHLVYYRGSVATREGALLISLLHNMSYEHNLNHWPNCLDCVDSICSITVFSS